MKFTFSLYLIVGLVLGIDSDSFGQQANKPNIVIIYADDMGYGDLNCQNPDSKIPTVNLDKLASEGMRFTDAHSSSGICSPSRFALLTGMYHWRRQHDIIKSFGSPFFHDSDYTLPQMLSENDYVTAAIGKWHLGWDWEFLNEPTSEIEKNGKITKYYGAKDLDWTKPIKGGPTARGFIYYFGDGTINFPPYAWIENDKLLEIPTEELDNDKMPSNANEGNWEFRPGPALKGWDPYKVLPTLTQKAKDWIGNQKADQPFFLYMALPSPHAPIIPNDEFIGTSKAGAYGDFVVQTDWVAGEVLKALKENGFEENTLVIFTSDNGPENYAFARAENFGHFSMGDFRGLKRDVWEGGHHVPFIAKWPNKIKSGSVTNELISQIDIMNTVANILEVNLPGMAAPDSYNLLPVFFEKEYSKPLREATVHNTYANKWGIRKGDWLYINYKDGEQNRMPESFKKLRDYEDFTTAGLLFNMKIDPYQRVNLYDENPDKVKELSEMLDEYSNGRSSKR
ncbi:Sulfatase [Spirosomataceae bacterium TFI 002]|nr:Sulfatase [Spirosomataceae bacterium TFI 002]